MENKITPKILIVDDRPENLLVLESLLEGPELEIVRAESGNEALALMLEHEFALVLLDVQMPVMDGFETAEIMRSNEKNMYIPIIFVTAISQEQKYVFKGYEKGAVDYLFKPLDENILKSKVTVFLDLYRQRKVLEDTVAHLARANQQLIQQQKSVIEEERLKLLLQMAGATADEMNQPMTALLGGLELMDEHLDSPKLLREDIVMVQQAGNRLKKTIKQIQNVRKDAKDPADKDDIINLDQKISILSVEDSLEYFRLLKQIIGKKENIQLVNACDIVSAHEKLSAETFDLVLLDHELPDGTAFDFFKMLRKVEYTVPVVIITGQGDEVLAAQLLQSGADDYLPKMKINKENLFNSIENAMERHRLKQEVRVTMQQMALMATTDSLTGLYNRRYFTEILKRDAVRVERYPSDLSICMMDLDLFKNVNDSYGHPAGDVVLAEVAKLFKACLRTADCLCRYGGEEFAAIFSHTSGDDASAVCERLRKTVADHIFIYNEFRIYITLSIGIAHAGLKQKQTAGELLEQADRALYRAKEAGRNRVVCIP